MHSERNSSSTRERLTDFFGLSVELISLMFISRLIVTIVNRMFIPFFPQFAEGYGLTITAFSWVLSIRALAGIMSPVIGMLADRHGRRMVMSITLVLRGLTLMALPAFEGWWSLIPMVVLSLTTAGYIPVLRAYLSDMVRANRRGRALAAVDASFSAAGFIGLPLVGWMIESWSWKVPLLVMGLLHFAAVIFVSVRLPKTAVRTQENTFKQLRELLGSPKVLASMGVSSLMLLNFFMFMMFWAYLLADDFGFSPIQIGLMGTWIGSAEFVGLLLAGVFIDRIGKRRGSMIGILLTAVLYLVFLLLHDSLFTVRILLILISIALEFTITAVIPLYAEQSSEFRATVFCLITFGDTLALGVTPPLTTYLWTEFGLPAVVLVGAASSLVALLLVKKYLFEQPAAAES